MVNTEHKKKKGLVCLGYWALGVASIYALLGLGQCVLREVKVRSHPELYVDAAIAAFRPRYPTVCRENMKSCSFDRGGFLGHRYLDLSFEDEEWSVDIAVEIYWHGLGEKHVMEAWSPPAVAPREQLAL